MFKLVKHYIANPGSGPRRQFERMLMFCGVLFYAIGQFVAPKLGVAAACFTIGFTCLFSVYIDTKSKTTRGMFGQLYTDKEFPGARSVSSGFSGFAGIVLLIISLMIVSDSVPDKESLRQFLTWLIPPKNAG